MQPDKVPYYILDLLQQVPSVYVKGLGRFDAIFHAAVIDIPQARIKPPFIEPDFQEENGAGNGLLASYIRYVSGIDVGSAQEAIDDFVQKILQQTEGGNHIAIEKFGSFTRSAIGSIRFTPDWDAFNLSFSGLEVIDISLSSEEKLPEKTLVSHAPGTDVHEEKMEMIAPVIDNHLADPESRVPRIEDITAEVQTKVANQITETTSRLWWLILSSALVLIGLLCAYLTWDIITNRKRLKELEQIYQGSAGVITPGETIVPLDTLPIEVENLPIEEPEETPDTTPVPGDTGIDQLPCFVVVGAFSDPANVTRMMERLESMGYIAEQIKGGALTRVAIRTSCDRTNLQRTLDEARASVSPEAWIY